MKSVFSATAALTVLGLVDAKASFTNSAFSVVKGQPFTLTWSSTGTGPYTVTLKNGPSTNLSPVETLGTTSSLTLTWTPESSLASGTYAFQIDDASDSQSNWSNQFTYVGASGSSSASTASATSSASSSSKSSSASVTSTSSSSSSASKSESTSITSTASSNGTVSATLTTHTSSATSKATTSSSASTSTTSTPNTNDARGFVAPILGVVAAAVMAL